MPCILNQPVLYRETRACPLLFRGNTGDKTACNPRCGQRDIQYNLPALPSDIIFCIDNISARARSSFWSGILFAYGNIGLLQLALLRPVLKDA
jgi:hypothetical protein